MVVLGAEEEEEMVVEKEKESERFDFDGLRLNLRGIGARIRVLIGALETMEIQISPFWRH